MKTTSIKITAAILMLCTWLPGLCASPAENGFRIDRSIGRSANLDARCLAQDSRGAIWFGTTTGLECYDGNDIRSYRWSKGNIVVNSIASYHDRFYLGCDNGLMIYDPYQDDFEPVEPFRGKRVNASVLKGDCLFLGTQNGFYRYMLPENSGQPSVTQISHESVFSLSTHGSVIWVGTSSGLARYDIRNDTYSRFDIEHFANSSLKMAISTYQADNSTLWVGTPNYLLKVDMFTGRTILRKSFPVVKNITDDGSGNLLIGTDSGLFHVDRTDGTDTILSSNAIWGSLKDRDGNTWFATDNELMLSIRNRTLKTIDLGSAPENARYSYIMRDSKGYTWAASNHGLLRIEDSIDGSYIASARYDMGNLEHSIPHTRVKMIAEDKSSGHLYAAINAGYLKLDGSTMEFDWNEIKGTYSWIYDIIPCAEGLWIATFQGLYLIKDQNVVLRIGKDDGLDTDDVSQIAMDRSGRIWLLTRDQNVFTYDPQTKELDRFALEALASSPHACRIISDNGEIWIATSKDLLNAGSQTDGNVQSRFQLATCHGIDVYSMVSFLNRIWLCTSDGVMFLDKRNGSIEHLDVGTGYVSIAYDHVRNNILLGGLGTISFIPAESADLNGTHKEAPVTITSVRVNDDLAISRMDIESGHISLKSSQNNLNISFTDFSYDNEIQRRFRFSLSGRNSSWNDVVSGNSIVLADLKPGVYRLFITSDESLDASDPELLEIRIRYPWYLSIYMLLAYLAVFVALVIWIIHFLTLRRYLLLERQQRDILVEQSRQKEDFAIAMAHELKTPLSLIMGPLSKVIKETDDPETLKMLKMAQDNATRLNSLVHNSLDYYLGSNRATEELIKTEVEFVGFAKTVFSTYRESHPKKEFIFASTSSMIYADVDIVKMEAVLGNLLSNSCKYTPDGGSIILSIDHDSSGNKLIIKVSDTGIGIPEDEQAFVFQRFYESSRTKGKSYDSTGIGLYTIKKYVTAHNGDVSVESDRNGTTFTIIIPCREIHEAEASAESTEVDRNDTRPLVVVVDDNAQICTFLETILKDKYRCITSNNGKSGLKLCKDVVPDLVISDVMMPEMDGFEMCREIRRYRPLSTIPIIFLTAKDDTDTEKRSIDLNIDSFFSKPFDFSTLLAKVDQLIGNKQRMEQKIRMEMIGKPEENGELSYDEKYLRKITRLIEEHIDDSDLSVKALCELGGFSEKQLYRKVKQLTGMSTVEYIRSIRLKKAALLLQKGTFTVSEAMYSVGFSNASYFTRAFSAEYGKTPSEYQKSHSRKD